MFESLLFFGLLVGAGAAYMSQQQPKTPKQKPVSMEGFQFPQCDEGTPQEVIFGDCWTEDWMVLGVGNYRTSKIRTKSGK